MPGGFARNYLLKFRKARYATPENIAALEEERKTLEQKDLQRQQEAKETADRLEGYTLRLVREAGDSGVLYGSVSGSDIARLLKEEGYSLARQNVRLSDPIKMVGSYTVSLDLHPQVTAEIVIEVVTR